MVHVLADQNIDVGSLHGVPDENILVQNLRTTNSKSAQKRLACESVSLLNVFKIFCHIPLRFSSKVIDRAIRL